MAYQQSLVPFGYETFTSPELGPVQERSTALPRDPTFFESCPMWDMSGLDFPFAQDLLLKSLLVTSTESTRLERNTRQQAKTRLWKTARQARLTASSFGEATTWESWTLKGLVNLTSSKDLSRARAVRHGIKYEPVAVQCYETYLRGHDVQTFPCGFLVHPDCPWLGASPERVAWDPA